jgi:hypothetical protein
VRSEENVKNTEVKKQVANRRKKAVNSSVWFVNYKKSGHEQTYTLCHLLFSNEESGFATTDYG